MRGHMIELNNYCSTCKQSNTERVLAKTNTSNRAICKECGAYKPKRAASSSQRISRIKRDAPSEPSYTVPEVTNPTPTIGPRAQKIPAPKRPWPYKKYTEADAANLGIDLLKYLEEHRDLRSFDYFLNNIAHMSYSKLMRMAEASPDLQESVLLAKQIMAERWQEAWETHERMDINKLAPKFLDVFSALMQEQQDKKMKIEHSVGQGIPYHDPTYPNLLTKE